MLSKFFYGSKYGPFGAKNENTLKIRCLQEYWRRERDSNPRYAINVYSLSRGALSTTQPSLRYIYSYSVSIRPREGWIRSLRSLTPSGRLRRPKRFAFCRTLDTLSTYTPLAGERFDSGLRPSPFGRFRYAPASKIADGDFVDHSAISPNSCSPRPVSGPGLTLPEAVRPPRDATVY